MIQPGETYLVCKAGEEPYFATAVRGDDGVVRLVSNDFSNCKLTIRAVVGLVEEPTTRIDWRAAYPAPADAAEFRRLHEQVWPDPQP